MYIYIYVHMYMGLRLNLKGLQYCDFEPVLLCMCYHGTWTL